MNKRIMSIMDTSKKIKHVKRIALLLLGLLPLLLFGYFLLHLTSTNHYVDDYSIAAVRPSILMIRYSHQPFSLIDVAVLAVWLIFGMISVFLVSSRKEALLILNASAFLVLVLILFQEWVLGGMWINQVGLATKMFYLPLSRLGIALSLSVFRQSSNGIESLLAFICIFGLSYFGRILAERICRVIAKGELKESNI